MEQYQISGQNTIMVSGSQMILQGLSDQGLQTQAGQVTNYM